MGEQNIKTVQALFDAFGRGDVGFILDHVSPDVTWESIGDPAIAGHYGARSGKPGVVDFFTKLGGENDFKAFVPEIFDASPDKVFVEGHSEMVKRAGGKTVKERWLMVFTFKDGKVADYREWDNSAGHLQAKG